MNALDFGQLLPLLAIAVTAGIFGGILAGLLGVGGGIVIVPALYLALSTAGMDPAITMQVAVGTSLATIVFTSLSSGYGHFKRGAIDMDLLKLWAPSLLVGVVIGALLGGYVSGLILVGVFATVAALVALDMIFARPRRPHPARLCQADLGGAGCRDRRAVGDDGHRGRDHWRAAVELSGL